MNLLRGMQVGGGGSMSASEILEALDGTEQIDFIEQGRKIALAQIGVANGTDADHDLDFTDPNGTFFSGTITKQADATFAAGTGAGMLDTGALAADTLYYLFIIKKTSDGTYDFLASASRTSPTIPSGYGNAKFFFAFITNASNNILAFKKVGTVWIPSTYPAVDASDATTSDRTFETCTVKAPANCDALIAVQSSHSAGQTNLGELIRSEDESSENGTSFANKFNILSSGVMTLSEGANLVRLGPDSQVQYAVGKTGAGTTTVTVRVLQFRIPLEAIGA